MSDGVESSAGLVLNQNLLKKSPESLCSRRLVVIFYSISFLFHLFIFLRSFWDVFESVIILPEEARWLKYAVRPLPHRPCPF